MASRTLLHRRAGLLLQEVKAAQAQGHHSDRLHQTRGLCLQNRLGFPQGDLGKCHLYQPMTAGEDLPLGRTQISEDRQGNFRVQEDPADQMTTFALGIGQTRATMLAGVRLSCSTKCKLLHPCPTSGRSNQWIRVSDRDPAEIVYGHYVLVNPLVQIPSHNHCRLHRET